MKSLVNAFLGLSALVSVSAMAGNAPQANYGFFARHSVQMNVDGAIAGKTNLIPGCTSHIGNVVHTSDDSVDYAFDRGNCPVVGRFVTVRTTNRGTEVSVLASFANGKQPNRVLTTYLR